jgi:hypothetical protein
MILFKASETMTEKSVHGYIYRISSASTDKVYVGSTQRSIISRFNQHKYKYKFWQQSGSSFMSSFEVVKFDDAQVELVEEIICDDVKELFRREGQVIQETVNCVNRYIPGTNYKDYYRRNAAKIIEAARQYQLTHPEKRANYYERVKHKYNEKHSCGCGGCYTTINKKVHMNSMKHKRYEQQRQEDDDISLIDDIYCIYLGYQ